jgi:hypothetical protein
MAVEGQRRGGYQKDDMAGYLAQIGTDRAVEWVHGAQPERLREQDRSAAPEQDSKPQAHGERPSALYFCADVLVVFAIIIAVATARTGARPGAAGTATAAAGAGGGGARSLVRVLLLASLLGHIAFEFHLSVALHCGDPHLGQG